MKRIQRINTESEDTDRDIQQLKHHMKKRGYPDKVLCEAHEMTIKKSIEAKQPKENIIFTTTYNPNLPRIENVLDAPAALT